MQQVYEKLIQSLLGKGFGSVDHWFSTSEIQGLRETLLYRYSNENFAIAGIGNQQNLLKEKSIRNDRIYWLDNNSHNEFEAKFFQELNRFIDYLNFTCFTGINSYEFHYAVYEPGAFYKKHVDQFSNDKRRKFSFIMYLTEDWQEGDGGELMIYDENPIKISPEGGRIVFFMSENVEHEVLVTSKQRLSITGWLKTS